MKIYEFNRITGKHFDENESNVKTLEKAAGATEQDVQDFLTSPEYKLRPKTGYHVLREFVSWYKRNKGADSKGKRAPKPKAPKAPKPEPKPKKPEAPKPEPEAPKVPEALQKAIDGAASGKYHEKMPDIIDAMLKHHPVYLFGPSGSGKSYIAEQAAEILGTDYHFTNKVDMKVDLEGFADAGGRYVETEFYRAMKGGGVFFFDEADASDSNAFTWTNAATSSRTAVFPVVGRVDAPSNLYFMAAGNTCGTGADGMYTGRNALDAACLNRFAKFEIAYDPKIEDKLGSKECVEFVRTLRRAAENAGIELIASYRTITGLEDLSEGGRYANAVSAFVTAGMNEDDLYNLRNDAKMRKLIEQENPFAMAL